MKILNPKWLVFGLIPICMGCETMHTEITIPAEPEKVWSVLTDAASYSEWNPVFIQVNGEFREGATLQNQVKDGKGNITMMESTVRKIEKPKLLNQYGGIPGVLTFDHTYTLEPVEGGTRVIQHEEDRGIGLLFWDASWVEPAYQKVNEALRERVMQLENSN